MWIYLILIIATALFAVWFSMTRKVVREDWILAAKNRVLDNRAEIEKLKNKDKKNAEKLSQYQGIAEKVMRLIYGGNSDKKIGKLTIQNKNLTNGDLRSVNVLDLPGYAIQRNYEKIGLGNIHKKLMNLCTELYGRKYAENKTRQLMARILSYPVIGIAFTLSLGSLLLVRENKTTGFTVMGIGTILVLFLVYALYDDISDKLKKRRAEISRQFPNVVSKLALLVTSGMIMDRAWRETADSQDSTLYLEMRKTADELDNLVDPTTAYTNFIDRCHTVETTKLASALIQNQSKGNAEIGRLLKDMAKEAWLERRHNAKRESENANGKLLIPTILLFVAILIMIMVPITTSFQGF